MGGTLVELLAAVRTALAGVDVSLLSGAECAGLVEALALTEKACGAVRAPAALRATACGAHRERGFAEASDWLAWVWGVTGAEAQRVLATAEGLEALPEVRAAAAAGALSLVQAHELVTAERSPRGRRQSCWRTRSANR